MTPQEKANVLHTLMYGDLHNNMTWQEAKRCALIAVDEIMIALQEKENWYWQDVKQEIEKL